VKKVSGYGRFQVSGYGQVSGVRFQVSGSALPVLETSYETSGNVECRLTNGGIALRGVGVRTPTSRRLRSG
jgi:hypothetical protein